jgi:hypothetical protein
MPEERHETQRYTTWRKFGSMILSVVLKENFGSVNLSLSVLLSSSSFFSFRKNDTADLSSYSFSSFFSSTLLSILFYPLVLFSVLRFFSLALVLLLED